MKKNNILKISTLMVLVLILLCGNFYGCQNAGENKEQYSVVVDKSSGIDYSSKIGNLVENNRSSYTIVYSVNAGDAIVEGAKEIKQMLFDSSSAYVNIVTDEGLTYDDNCKYISLGNTKLLQNSSLKLDYSLLKHDGFFIKTSGNSVFIDGGSDRAVLYGAYDFCEHVIGVKYLTYDYNYIPNHDSIAIYEMDITDNPAFNDRCYQHTKLYSDYKFMSRMRFVHEYREVPDMYGGDIGWFMDTNFLHNYVHNTLDFVEPSLYYESHRDWFYVEDGEICDLCYSHVGLNEDGTIDESLEISPVKVAIEKLKQCFLNSNDSIKYYMIGQMDLKYTCQCASCLEQEAKYERSGMNIRFINAIYDEVSKWAKEQGITREWYLCTFAYQWSQSAPVKKVDGKLVILDETVMPRDNVIVRIAPIQANNYYGMVDEKQNEKTRDLFEGWKSILKDKKTMIWSYHSRFSYYFCYYPTMQHWKEDFKLYQEIGSQYIYMQPDYNESHDWKVNMETYVASKMLWNPDLDATALRDEFFHYYYKDIADLVSEYNTNFEVQFALIAGRSDAPDLTLQAKDELLDVKYYSVPFWESQLKLIDDMYKRVAELNLNSSDKASYKTKIDELKLTSEFMILFHYDTYYFDDYWGKQDMLNDFFDTYLSLGIRNWREHNAGINTIKSLLGYIG